jgi:hypothetical protein
MKKSNKIVAALSVAAVSSPSFAALDTTALQTAATEFQTDFIIAAAIIGVAAVTASYGGVIWKWIKAMVWS